MAEARTYLLEWRKRRGFTQAQVVDRLRDIGDQQLPQTEASLSRLENGKQPYSQRVLEALAIIYQTAPADLLGHDPNVSAGIIDLWRKVAERDRARALKTLASFVDDEATG